MEEHTLKGEYISAVLSYGGSQRWSDSPILGGGGGGGVFPP